MNYFMCSNAGEPKAGIQFEKVENLGGTIWGVYATDNPEEISKLDAIIGKSSVIALDEHDFRQMLKKKQPGLEGSRILNVPQLTPPKVAGAASIKTPVAVVVENHEDHPVEIVKELNSPEDALKVGDLKKPEEHKSHKKSHKPAAE